MNKLAKLPISVRHCSSVYIFTYFEGLSGYRVYIYVSKGLVTVVLGVPSNSMLRLMSVSAPSSLPTL